MQKINLTRFIDNYHGPDYRMLKKIKIGGKFKKLLRPIYWMVRDVATRCAIWTGFKSLLYSKKKYNYFLYLFNRLNNEEDKKLLEAVAAMRTLGPSYIKFDEQENVFSQTQKELWQSKYKQVDGYFIVNLRDFNLTRMDVWVEIEPYILASLVCGQYQHSLIIPRPGDWCMDLGTYMGEASLLFADKVDKVGRVYAVEFGTKQLEILDRNLNYNQSLKNRIHVITSPLWSKTGVNVYMSSSGGCTKLSFSKINEADQCFSTLSLDDAVEKYKIEKLDILKMDVEGAEFEILQGGIKTLLRFKPRLAISIYHSDLDFDRIPKLIDSLNCGYEFYLGHYTGVSSETILYAKA